MREEKRLCSTSLEQAESTILGTINGEEAMEPVHLFSLIGRQQAWLSTRQALVAQNIANIDTPGYRAVDAAPFERAMARVGFEMSASSSLHMRPAATETLSTSIRTADGWETNHSGNTVSAELEMIKAGDIRNAYALNASVMRAFHGMWMATVKP
jgi:flagellar basal-body rod protein FlgB